MDDEQDTATPPPVDPMTLALVLYAFRLVHAWMHDLPTDQIQADLIAAASEHHLWRAEYAADATKVPGAEPTDGPQGDGAPRLKLVE